MDGEFTSRLGNAWTCSSFSADYLFSIFFCRFPRFLPPWAVCQHWGTSERIERQERKRKRKPRKKKVWDTKTLGKMWGGKEREKWTCFCLLNAPFLERVVTFPGFAVYFVWRTARGYVSKMHKLHIPAFAYSSFRCSLGTNQVQRDALFCDSYLLHFLSFWTYEMAKPGT